MIIAAAAIVAVAVAWQPALPEVPPPPSGSFDHALVMRGEGLAQIGDCVSCHTAPDGRAFAGGRPLETPFGTIFATNITPDPKTGIGRWSSAAFVRALRTGVARNGDYLYPAFPYDHFTKASDADLEALYAFLMTRPPVDSRAPANRLIWPLNFRPIMAAWNLLYLRKGPANDADRGRTLAEGLAHCGSCHTPRNRLGAEIPSAAYDGAWTEGWYAAPINAHSPAVRPWTAEELTAYLRTGFSATHSAAAGPMAQVIRELGAAPEEDVRAIATYFASLMADAPAAHGQPPTNDNRGPAEQASPQGATLFAGACAGCHETGAPMMQQGRPSLAWGTSLREDAPHDTLYVIVQGLTPPNGRPGPTMPAFGNDFTDRQLGEIATYLRARYTDLPPWPDIDKAMSDVRKGGGR
jgi:mono/diheme cytochrome c family protein